MTLDELELELRKLPGVRAVGFTERDKMLFVQLHSEGTQDSELSLQAAKIAQRGSELPVTVEVVRWQSASIPKTNALHAVDLTEEERASATVVSETETRGVRVKLLAVLSFPDTDEVEVHLTFGGERSVGRAKASAGLSAAVIATLDAVHEFVIDLPYRGGWAREVTPQSGHGFVVAVGIGAENGETPSLFGAASGSSPLEAAARATLQALNRSLVSDLTDLLDSLGSIGKHTPGTHMSSSVSA